MNTIRLLLLLLSLKPAVAISLGVIVIGDSGTGSKYQYDVSSAIGIHCRYKACDLGIIVGDIIYPNGIKKPTDKLLKTNFEDVYNKLKFEFYPALGNHDHRGSWRAMVNYDSPHWEMPARWYHLDQYPDVDIFALDTQYFDHDQQKWLEAGLKASKKKWKLVYGHHPIFSSGSHGDGYLMKRHLLPLIKKYNVDFYFAGHDHHMELIDKDGIVTIISGAAGKLRPVSRKSGSVFAKSDYGFAYIEFIDDRAVLEFVDRGNMSMFYSYFKKDN